MPINVHWADAEKRIVHMQFVGEWHWGQHRRAIRETQTMFDSSPHTIHVIVDLTWGPKIPAGAFNHLQDVYADLPPNLGMLVFVGGDDFLTVINNVLLRHDPRPPENTATVKYFHEALQIIADHRADWARRHGEDTEAQS